MKSLQKWAMCCTIGLVLATVAGCAIRQPYPLPLKPREPASKLIVGAWIMRTRNSEDTLAEEWRFEADGTVQWEQRHVIWNGGNIELHCRDHWGRIPKRESGTYKIIKERTLVLELEGKKYEYEIHVTDNQLTMGKDTYFRKSS
jgi:hypothetical protein